MSTVTFARTKSIDRTATRVKPSRRFGAGILATRPSYRLDCTIQDLAWYEEQLALEEERMLARRFAEYEAQSRMDQGLEPW